MSMKQSCTIGRLKGGSCVSYGGICAAWLQVKRAVNMVTKSFWAWCTIVEDLSFPQIHVYSGERRCSCRSYFAMAASLRQPFLPAAMRLLGWFALFMVWR
jgi:hypothetical protein